MEDVAFGYEQGASGTGGSPINLLIDNILSNSKIRIFLITLDAKIKKTTTLRGENFDVMILPKSKRGARYFYLPDILKLIRSLRGKVHQFDIIHSHWPIYSVPALLVARKKTIVSLHDHPINCLRVIGVAQFPNVVLSIFCYIFAPKLTVVSSHILALALKFRTRKCTWVLRNFQKASAQDIIINGPGRDTSRGPSFEKFSIISIGDATKLKNINALIDALDLLPADVGNKIIRVTIVGKGFQRKIEMHNGIQVEYIGECSHERCMDLISESDVLVHPSLEEALPGPVIEAVIRKKIVICNDVGESNYILGGGKYGVISGALTPGALAQAIIIALRTHSEIFENFSSWDFRHHQADLVGGQRLLQKIMALYDDRLLPDN